MKNTMQWTATLLLAGSVLSAHAQKTVTTRRGGTATTQVTQQGKSVTGTATATSANGQTVSGSATATKTRTGATESATVTGPKGGTTTASGTTTTNADGSVTQSTTVTGPQGQSRSHTGTHGPKQ